MLTVIRPGRLTRVFVFLIAVAVLSAARAGCVLKFGGPETSTPVMSFDEVDHTNFHVLLQRYVDQRGRVCYSDWAEHCCDVSRLQGYLNYLTHVDPTRPASKEATLAYYINAYNALTLWGILDNYPVVSIQKLDGEKSCYTIFDDLRLWVGNRHLSLNGIENDAVRPMGDPRIHFALVCAARGCPRLRNEAFQAHCLDGQLNDNAIEFFSDRNRFHISRLTKKVKISPILKWYREDFGQTDYQVVTTVFRFLPHEDRCWLASHPGWKLDHLGYDWGLNDGCPALSVGMGRIPYRAWSKISPMIAPLMPQSDDEASGNATVPPSATNPPENTWSPENAEPLELPQPDTWSEPPVPGEDAPNPDDSPLPLPSAVERPPVPPAGL